MNRTSSRSSTTGASASGAILSVAALALAIAVAFVAAGCGASAAPDPSSPPAPSPVATPAPTAPGTPGASPSPSAPAPSPAPSRPVDGSQVPLDVFLGHEVVLAISDPGALLVEAASGAGKDGMSVRWGEAIVRNLDSNTIEVTWPGFPRDELVTLVVRAEDEGILLRFGQDAPPANSDAMGADRVVVLTFAGPVDAGDVTTDFTTVDD